MKQLSFTSEDINEILEEFKTNLINFKSNQDKFVYEKKFSELTNNKDKKLKKPIIYFTMEAWLKMLSLVKTCDKEIAWQATVEKRKFKNKEDSDDFYYYITQVVVYPQKVTGTFVDVDTVKYAEWSLNLPDETYNKLRFQGHSHVNMAVAPSGTDLNTYQNFLEQLDENDFYIFMIINKRSEFNIMVYDYAQNTLFENADCYVDIITSNGSLNKWVDESMKLVEFKNTINYPLFDPIWSTPSCKNEQTKDKVTYVNQKGYMQDNRYHTFNSVDEAIDWFTTNPEYIDKANLTPDFKKVLAQALNPTANAKQKTKKGTKK